MRKKGPLYFPQRLFNQLNCHLFFKGRTLACTCAKNLACTCAWYLAFTCVWDSKTTNNKQTTTNKQQQTTNKQQQTTNTNNKQTNNKQQATNNKQQTTNKQQQTNNNEQQTNNNKQQTTNNKQQQTSTTTMTTTMTTKTTTTTTTTITTTTTTTTDGVIAWRSDYLTNFVLDSFQFFCIAASSKARSTSELMSYYEAVAVVATMSNEAPCRGFEAARCVKTTCSQWCGGLSCVATMLLSHFETLLPPQSPP